MTLGNIFKLWSVNMGPKVRRSQET